MSIIRALRLGLVQVRRSSSGMSMAEIVIVSAILGILAVPMATFIKGTLVNVTGSNLKLQSQDALRTAFDEIERDFMEMNEVTISTSTYIEFRMDAYNLPGYNDDGDTDVDGIVNIRDPDDDGDVTSFTPPLWTKGYDLDDDDDDNDNAVDVVCRYRLSGKTLLREFNYNGAGWGNQKVLLTNVSTMTFTYYGSKNQDLGRLIDLGNDGTASTNDSGENDGIVTSREIDWVQAATGHGNRSGRIDTTDELRYIMSIHVQIAQDINGDGRNEFRLETQLTPPLLPGKRSL